MKGKHQLTKTEYEIMCLLWQHPGRIKTKEVLDKMNLSGKNWKRQTLNTLLYRLDQKQLVERTHAYVESIASKERLLQLQTQDMLDNLYGGEYLNFIAALTKNTSIDSNSKAMLDSLVQRLKAKSQVH